MGMQNHTDRFVLPSPSRGELIGARVKVLRQRYKWSQRQLNEKAALSSGYVNKLENGEIPSPQIDSLYKLAGAFRMRLTDILNDPTLNTTLETEEVLMARKIVVVLPDLAVDDPVELVRGIAGLPPAFQGEVEEFVTFMQWRAVYGKVRDHKRIARTALDVSKELEAAGTEQLMLKVAEDNEDYQVKEG